MMKPIQDEHPESSSLSGAPLLLDQPNNKDNNNNNTEECTGGSSSVENTNVDISSSKSADKEEPKTSSSSNNSKMKGFSISSRLSRSLQSNGVVGNASTLQKGQTEVRDPPKHYVYEPTARWWEPPLSAWLPESNREILAILFVYNCAVVFLARYTNLCGEGNVSDIEIDTSFCSDDFVLLEDKALTGFAVGMFLLLAFRANQAYDRFWEGRKNWGRLREVSRDFARLVCHHVRVETHDDVLDRRRAILFVAAFAAATKLHLRKERDIYRDICDQGLCEQDIANIQHAKHMPLYCQDILSDYLQKQCQAGKLSDFQMGVINTTSLAVMSDKLGSNERIANTPIPLSYVLQLRFFLILWLALYPLHVVAFYGWWTLLLSNLVCFAVLGIESMACEIENPFGYDRNDLDLDSMAKGFYADTQEILSRTESKDRRFLFDRQAVDQMSAQRFTTEEMDNLRQGKVNIKNTQHTITESGDSDSSGGTTTTTMTTNKNNKDQVSVLQGSDNAASPDKRESVREPV